MAQTPIVGHVAHIRLLLIVVSLAQRSGCLTVDIHVHNGLGAAGLELHIAPLAVGQILPDANIAAVEAKTVFDFGLTP